jgi:hypothetical protein
MKIAVFCVVRLFGGDYEDSEGAAACIVRTVLSFTRDNARDLNSVGCCLQRRGGRFSAA